MLDNSPQWKYDLWNPSNIGQNRQLSNKMIIKHEGERRMSNPEEALRRQSELAA